MIHLNVPAGKALPTTHTIKQGEHLSEIALANGFIQIAPIWNHTANAELKKKRKHPHVLFPGDKVVVPDKQVKTASGATEKRHRFQAKREYLVLRLVLQDSQGEPFADKDCSLLVDLERHELTTDGDGKIELPITAMSKTGVLTIWNLEIPLKIGHLDPVTEPSGQKARLNNLGYYAGEQDQNDENLFKSAVEEFQCEHELKVDGKCGPNTQQKLEAVYGY
ncbi:MAG: peptidoglycan-binding domain-containing protein [Proteobacteria bacterium]|nr:peptidoglycan-binding domain-containing protein [Pseudomonadota bacterium]